MVPWCLRGVLICSVLLRLAAAISDRRGEDVHLHMRDGVLFQTGGCPQAITSETAESLTNAETAAGNTISLTSFSGGRTGNHFMMISSYFSMAYCCSTKVLTMPETDQDMPTLDGGMFKPKTRWFDFSSSKPLQGYEGLSNRREVCRSNIVGHKGMAFRLEGVHEDLLSCMNRVFVRGCEAAYLGPIVDTTNTCPPRRQKDAIPSSENISTGENDAAEAVGQGSTRRRQVSAAAVDGAVVRGGFGRGNAGSLVVHIRSGDVFNKEKSFPSYGQPPLQFYISVIQSRAWSDVSIVTRAAADEDINPTFRVLQMLSGAGAMGPNVAVHKNRPWLVDLRAMLCADALIVARSTVHFLTLGHSRASRFFIPSSCGIGTFTRKTRHRGERGAVNPDNTTFLCAERPEAEVFGVKWTTGPEEYSVYTSWNNTEQQVLEMVTFDNASRLEPCCS